MNFIIGIGAISLLLFLPDRCAKDEISNGTPACVQQKIDEISGEDVWNPPARIYRYFYNGKKVYFIPQRCCDIPSQLVDENCNAVCAPDGGISGQGDGACPDFFNTRTGEQLIWEDNRQN